MEKVKNALLWDNLICGASILFGMMTLLLSALFGQLGGFLIGLLFVIIGVVTICRLNSFLSRSAYEIYLKEDSITFVSLKENVSVKRDAIVKIDERRFSYDFFIQIDNVNQKIIKWRKQTEKHGPFVDITNDYKMLNKKNFPNATITIEKGYLVFYTKGF